MIISLQILLLRLHRNVHNSKISKTQMFSLLFCMVIIDLGNLVMALPNMMPTLMLTKDW